MSADVHIELDEPLLFGQLVAGILDDDQELFEFARYAGYATEARAARALSSAAGAIVDAARDGGTIRTGSSTYRVAQTLLEHAMAGLCGLRIVA